MDIGDIISWAIVDYRRANNLPAHTLDWHADELAACRKMLRRGTSPQWAVTHAFDGPLRDHLLSVVGPEEA